MNLLGFEITRKAAPLRTVAGGGGWMSVIREPFTGAWQRNIALDNRDTVLASSAVYACITRIANDVAKLPINLVEEEDGIWNVVQRNSPFWPVLRKPNAYQNRIQFFVTWLLSKLTYGNTYVLKERDARGVVTGLHVLNAHRVTLKIAPDGGVYYELETDELYGLPSRILVPAREIIHDLMNPLFHPLCGVPPLFACAMTSTQSNRIQNFAALFFENMSRPSGILTSAGDIGPDLAKRMKEEWETNFSGNNIGRVAVAGGGLKYEAIGWPAQQTQLIEQLRWGVEDIARAFGMPLYKIGAGPVPTSNNVEALNQQYYDDCLQPHMEAIELCLDEGLGLTDVQGQTLGTEFDLDNLLRMDSATQIQSLAVGTGAGIYSINEARFKRNLPPAKGGEIPYLQQQNWPIRDLAERELPGEQPVAPPALPAPNDSVEPPGSAQGPDQARALTDALIAKFFTACHV